MTVIDIGANVGAHTLFFAKAVGPAGRVFAFEPQRMAVTRSYAAISRLTCSITSLPFMPDWEPGWQHRCAGDRLCAWRQLRGCALGKGSGEDVPLRTLDSFELAACDLIKIDVEGNGTVGSRRRSIGN